MTHGILLCDKPAATSSHAVVSLARKALGTRRVGHAGTLDPMATGLLVLAVGEGLKILRYLALDDKRYRATIELGAETDTLDRDGRIVARSEAPANLSAREVEAAAQAFVGAIAQVPPAISALKRDGVALYKRARRGEAVEPEPRIVQVHAIAIERVQGREIELSVHAGKGFYVRALARDLARALGTVGHLAVLRRLESGRFELRNAVDHRMLALAAQGELAARAELERALLPIERALEPAPKWRLDAAGAEHVRHGRPCSIEHVLELALRPADSPLEPIVLCDEQGTLIAIGRLADSTLRVVRGLRS